MLHAESLCGRLFVLLCFQCQAVDHISGNIQDAHRAIPGSWLGFLEARNIQEVKKTMFKKSVHEEVSSHVEAYRSFAGLLGESARAWAAHGLVTAQQLETVKEIEQWAKDIKVYCNLSQISRASFLMLPHAMSYCHATSNYGLARLVCARREHHHPQDAHQAERPRAVCSVTGVARQHLGGQSEHVGP